MILLVRAVHGISGMSGAPYQRLLEAFPESAVIPLFDTAKEIASPIVPVEPALRAVTIALVFPAQNDNARLPPKESWRARALRALARWFGLGQRLL